MAKLQILHNKWFIYIKKQII